MSKSDVLSSKGLADAALEAKIKTEKNVLRIALWKNIGSIGVFVIHLWTVAVFSILNSLSFAQNNLTLEQAFQKTLARSENSQVQQILKEQAENALSRTQSRMLPTLDGQAALSRQGLQTAADGSITRDSSGLRVGLSQPLFRGFAVLDAINMAKYDVDRAQMTQENSRRLLWWTVVNGFYEVLAAERNFANLESLEKVFEKREREIRKRTGLGKSRSSDLQVTASQRLTVHAQVLKAKNDLKVSKLYLSQLTGEPMETLAIQRPLVAETKPAPIPDSRPDLKFQELTVKRADAEIGVAQATLWPELNLSANYYPYYAYDPAPRSAGDLRWDAGLNLKWVLDWEDWTNKSGYDRRLNLKIEELRLKEARRHANEELERRRIYRKGVVQQFKDLSEALKMSDRATQLIQRDYNNGTASLLDIQTQQNAYYEIKRQFDTLDLEGDLVNLEIQWLQGEVIGAAQ